MELSSPRFKALAVSAGFSFWFFIITSIFGLFPIEWFVIFVVIVFPLMQLLAIKVSKVLDVLSIFTTKVFLGILFATVISVYGIFFRVLHIDLLRLNKKEKSYWLQHEQLSEKRILKEF